jgi:anti-sigma B factor antagonist
MNFSIEQRDNVAIVTSKVEKLDALQAPDLKAQLVLLGKSGTKNIILDLSESRYCDSSGLSAVLVGKRLCGDAGGSFVLCGLQPSVEKLISIAQLHRVLNIVPTAKEAVDMVYMEVQEREVEKED